MLARQGEKGHNYWEVGPLSGHHTITSKAIAHLPVFTRGNNTSNVLAYAAALKNDGNYIEKLNQKKTACKSPLPLQSWADSPQNGSPAWKTQHSPTASHVTQGHTNTKGLKVTLSRLLEISPIFKTTNKAWAGFWSLVLPPALQEPSPQQGQTWWHQLCLYDKAARHRPKPELRPPRHLVTVLGSD